MNKHILVADDDDLSREFLAEAFRASGATVDEARTGEQAARLFDKSRHDLVFTDIRMPDGDGLGLLSRVKAISPSTPVILVTAFGSVETAVQTMRDGAEDFIMKPVSIEQIELCLRRLDERQSLVRENKVLRARLGERGADQKSIIGESPQWLRCLAMAERVAESRATVLVRGESGTGKEVIASVLHTSSNRQSGPFIKTNCAVLQDSLLTSELFGHEKGAFTNAHQRKEGRFELAHGGTLFLDEIGEISPEIQAKLLRVLESGEFERVGGKETLKVDVRVVCATNRDLEQMMRDGSFRDDLYYRLNVVPIEVPPLRERGEDLVLLAKHFLEIYGAEFSSPVRTFSAGAMRRLALHPWPGNVRELANLVQRVALLAIDEIVTEDQLALEPRNSSRVSESIVGQTIADVERKLILGTLGLTKNNKTEAARILGVTSRTLSNKMRLYREQGHVPSRQSVMG
ncbi:MAG: sigma-54 dependent transcriptional regulator [Planctomycetota bacterium]